jgi:hypothetical protein
MKSIGTYTVRGSVGDGVTDLVDGVEEKIRLFDGRFDTAYKVTTFICAPGDADDPDITARLTTEPNLPTSIVGFWNWGDNRQIAWTSSNGATDVFVQESFGLVDPDNLVVEDLYVSFRFNAADTKLVNYMITMEKFDITDARGALAMVRNKSQGSSA